MTAAERLNQSLCRVGCGLMEPKEPCVSWGVEIFLENGHFVSRDILWHVRACWRQWLNYSARGGDSCRCEAWRAEGRAWMAESRGGVPDWRPKVFEHSSHSVWLLWHLIVFDACNIYPHQAWTNANDKMTVKDYIFNKSSCIEKNTLI